MKGDVDTSSFTPDFAEAYRMLKQALEELGFGPMAILKAYGALERAWEKTQNVKDAVARAVAEANSDPHVMGAPSIQWR